MGQVDSIFEELAWIIKIWYTKYFLHSKTQAILQILGQINKKAK